MKFMLEFTCATNPKKYLNKTNDVPKVCLKVLHQKAKYTLGKKALMSRALLPTATT